MLLRLVVIAASLLPGCASLALDDGTGTSWNLPNHLADAARPPVRLSVIHTGETQGPKGFLVDGACWTQTVKLSHVAILVEHPNATFLFDTGLGRNVDAQTADWSFWRHHMFSYTRHTSAVEQLEAHGFPSSTVDYVVLSHLHWDHASGVPDFPHARVMVPAVERTEAMRHATETSGFIGSQYNAKSVQWADVAFEDGAVGPFPASKDLFHDGSVILLPLEGHTPGSMAMLLELGSGRRVLFVGDLVWLHDGVEHPAQRSVIARNPVDGDADRNWKAIQRVHHFHKANPDILIAPAHDAEVMATLAAFPLWER